MPAYLMGIMGEPNTGKSYSRINTDSTKGFVIMPDLSDPHLLKKDKPGESVDSFDFIVDGKSYTKTIAKVLGIKYDEDDESLNINNIIETIMTKRESLVDNFKGDAATKNKIKSIFDNIGKFCTGNYIVCSELNNLKNWLRFVSKYMPHIQHIFLPDFTHYLTNVVASKEFSDKGKTSGGAYGRYTDLATETVKTFFTTTISQLRNDIIVVIEFHVTTDKDDLIKIFVPSGQMLDSTFKVETYFGVLLGSKQNYNEKDKSKRYTFITQATDTNRYVRCAGLIEEDSIPNDLNIVFEAYKSKNPNIFNKSKITEEENATV